MDPERTIVRVASSSKLVTATAAMQLVAQGKLDLQADVDRSLEAFQLEEAFGEPVTLHHLLTHTAGFDDRFLHSGRALGSPLPPLGDYLAQRMPPRVMPPGRVVSYSNHGLALVGHLVERASGLLFADYVQQNVFDPLGMTRSRFFLRVPLSSDVAVPYFWDAGRQTPLGYDHTLLGPAAELNTTALDMAKFMLAHLQQGDARLLDPDTERLMQAQHFAVHPKLPGWCYGFEESFVNGQRAVGHGGDWRGFESLLLLFLFGLGVIASELRPESFPDLLIQVPGLLRAGFAALSLAALLALALPWLAWPGFRPGTKAPLARFHYVLLAAAGLLLGAETLYWRIFGAILG